MEENLPPQAGKLKMFTNRDYRYIRQSIHMHLRSIIFELSTQQASEEKVNEIISEHLVDIMTYIRRKANQRQA